MSDRDDITAVVLAAGASTRMGRPKAFLPLGSGQTFVGHLLATLSQAGVSRVIVVTRSEWSDRIPRPAAGATDVVINPAPECGQLSSLQCGLSALSSTTNVVLITLVDVPLVAPETVGALIRAQRRHGADVVRPERAGRHGHPVIVTRAVADALLAAEPPETSRTVLARFAPTTLDVAVEDEGVFADVDTPEDYERLLASRFRTDRPGGPDED